MDSTSSCRVILHDRTRNASVHESRTVVVEGALVIRVNGASDYTIMRTPGNDRELTAGFLFTEGMIRGVADIGLLMECLETPNSIAVQTADAALSPISRTLVVNSSCGLCGRTDIEALLQQLGRIVADTTVGPETLYAIQESVGEEQRLFRATGATHAAALFDKDGRLLAVREDVGRHNALDKAIGYALLTAIPTGSLGVFLSGRASLEMVVKTARARIPIMVSVSAPTDAAIRIAEEVGITLVGFARRTGFTVYTHAERVRLPDPAQG